MEDHVFAFVFDMTDGEKDWFLRRKGGNSTLTRLIVNDKEYLCVKMSTCN